MIHPDLSDQTQVDVDPAVAVSLMTPGKDLLDFMFECLIVDFILGCHTVGPFILVGPGYLEYLAQSGDGKPCLQFIYRLVCGFLPHQLLFDSFPLF